MVSILIPAYNEAARIADTVSAARALEIAEGSEIIVIDDGSQDDTADAAEAAGAGTVLRQRNAGKGAALASGARTARGDTLLLLDADLGSTATEARKLLAPLLAGDADMTIATFPVRPGRGGGVGLVVRLARWGIHKLTGVRMEAPLSGQRALRRSVLAASGGFARGWGVEVDLTVRALWAGLRVREIATEMDHRVTGRSIASIMHRAGQFKAALSVLIRLWWTRKQQGDPAVRANTGNG